MPSNRISSHRRFATPLLTVDGLTKTYGADEGRAIDHVTFAAGAGEVLGVIGPNGAGKTTLLEAIAGLVPVESGQVFWRDEPLQFGDRRRAMFYLPDGVRPYRDQLTSQVLSFIAAVYRKSDADVAKAIAELGLEPVLRKRVHSLSKGYARRLMLALGLLAPHQLLLMDEPFDGFDLRQTRDIVGILRDQAARGRTFVLAIHQLIEAERVCDRFIMLSQGQMRGAGTLDELRAEAALPTGSVEDVFLALT
jgi:ABC-2 type transport system ATP-binding protein